MKALIVGAAGFVGSYLIDELTGNAHDVIATKLSGEEFNSQKCEIVNLDILSENEVVVVLEKSQPDWIFHLAAQSSVKLSWENPALTIDVNIKGTINLLEAVRKSEIKSRVLLIGTSEEYGAVKASDCPINEEHPINPQNVYAVTKAMQNTLGRLYAKAYGMDIINIRAFNHIGPRQIPQFVVADFCKQVAEIEKGLREPVIYVGNLDAARDFTDVRDIVRAYVMLAEKGKQGETYNVGSGKSVKISAILDEILSQSGTKIKTIVDENKYRPIDVPIIEADIRKLKDICGWQPRYNLGETISETFNYWRTYDG